MSFFFTPYTRGVMGSSSIAYEIAIKLPKPEVGGVAKEKVGNATCWTNDVFFFPCGTWASFFHRWLMVVSRFCPDMLREYPKIAQGVRQSNSWRKLLHSQGERDFLDCSFQGMLEVLKVMTSIGGSWDNWLMISWKLLKDTPNATVPPKKYGLRQAGIRIPMMIKYSRERKGKGSQCWNTLHEKVNKSYPKVCRDWWWITKYELHYIWIIGKETLEIHGDLVQVYDMYLTNLWSIAQKFNF